MKDLDALKSEFRAQALSPETLFLLCSSDAITFVQKGTASGLRLVGVEGFKVAEHGAFQPQQEHSNDIADTSMSDADFIAFTLDFIGQRAHLGIHFEVVFDKRST